MRLSSTSIGKDAALDAAHSLKTDTDSKLYGMGVGIELETTMEMQRLDILVLNEIG